MFHRPHRIFATLTVALLWTLTPLAVAQDRPDPQAPPPPPPAVDPDRPVPTDPPADPAPAEEEAPAENAGEEDATEDVMAVEVETDDGDDVEVIEIITPKANGQSRARADRRPVPPGEIKLGMKDMTLKELYAFIAVQTGKAVIPLQNNQAANKKFTIIMDDYLPREEALDMLFSYLRLNQVGVIERADVIIIGDLNILTKEMGEIDVVNADESVMNRIDRGTLILKIFQIEKANASDIEANIDPFIPDYAAISVDPLSNQIILLADVALCQQMEVIIEQLDRVWVNQTMQTFRLKFADAGEIADNVWDLFEGGGGGGAASRPSSGNRPSGNRPGGGGGNTRRATQGTTGEVEFRVTVNAQQNTLTVQSEPEQMQEIGRLIYTEWDLPRPEGTSRLFVLKYTDPLKVKELLEEVLGTGSSSTSNRAGGRGGAGGNNQRGDATTGISGVYRIDAYEDKNALLVLARTVESFTFIESIISDLDKPSNVGLPQIIPLK